MSDDDRIEARLVMEAGWANEFAAEHGLAALLDHLGLDGLGNEVVLLKAENDRLRADAERLAEALRPFSAFQGAGYLAGQPFEETYALLVKVAHEALAAHLLTPKDKP